MTEEIPQEVLGEVEALVEGAIGNVREALGGDVVPSCIICGARPAVSRTGRCDECKGKRLSANVKRIDAARAVFGEPPIKVDPPAPVQESQTMEELRAEVATLRAMLSSRQPLSLADFRERVEMLFRANVESYEDGGVKITFKPGAFANGPRTFTREDF